MKNTFFKYMKREHYYSLLEDSEVLVSNIYSYRNHQNEEIKDEEEATTILGDSPQLKKRLKRLF